MFDSVLSQTRMERMAATLRLRIEVEDDVLLVTLPGTIFRVIYSKPKKSPAHSQL